ncbi:Ribosomal protein L18 [Spironucleus salmonicida]|uniref:Ribosomal protein L18 n=1 Tax=Spironucleus salmonicida TaxID=348837 RepID=V6LY20_9EUKA|nr:Ribosomal protein L18 [Spironucleus salmonicida]|eukprot:EST49148.1 Ribosomal protein L18 [Spironucleus salmonicida]
MGIQLQSGDRKRTIKRTTPHTDNHYKNVIQSVYAQAAEKVENKDIALIAKRMCQSQTNQPSVSTSRLASISKNQQGKTLVLVSTVTNDPRVIEIPKMTVCALKFTATAKAHIEKFGGKCITFDDLILENPKMENVFMVQGKRSHRATYKKFGSAGISSSVVAKGHGSGCKGRKRQLHGLRW